MKEVNEYDRHERQKKEMFAREENMASSYFIRPLLEQRKSNFLNLERWGGMLLKRIWPRKDVVKKEMS
jgi:hypothetical protein